MLQLESIKENHGLADALLSSQVGEGGADLGRGEDSVQDRLELAPLDGLGDVLEGLLDLALSGAERGRHQTPPQRMDCSP